MTAGANLPGGWKDEATPWSDAKTADSIEDLDAAVKAIEESYMVHPCPEPIMLSTKQLERGMKADPGPDYIDTYRKSVVQAAAIGLPTPEKHSDRWLRRDQ